MTGLLTLCFFLLTPAPDLQPQQMLEQRVNVHTQGRQQSLTLDGNDERLVAVWTSQRQEAGSSGIYGRVLDPMLRPLGPELHLNGRHVGTQEHPAVAMADDGTVWVAWQSSGPGGYRIMLRRFDDSLLPTGNEIAVEMQPRGGDTLPRGIATHPSLDVADNGHLLVSWQVYAPGSSTAGVRSRLFDAAGQPLSDPIALTTQTSARLPSTVTFDADHFVVVWSERHGELHRLRAAQVSTADGRLVHRQDLAAHPDSSAIEPAASVGPDAHGQPQLAVAWMQSSAAKAASRNQGYDVWMQRFGSDLAPSAAAVPVADSSAGWRSGVTVRHLSEGRLAVLYNLDSSQGKDIWRHTFDADDRLEGLPRRIHQPAFPFESRRELLPAAASSSRAVALADGGLAVAWQGASGGDGHGVHVSAWVSDGFIGRHGGALAHDARAHGGPPEDLHRAAPAVAAVAPVPPIWKPNFRPSPRINGLIGGNDFGFEAIEETPWSPPDPEIAVGPDQLLFTSNGALTAFSKDGTQQWLDEIEGADGFWGALGAGGLVFDPEVVWDPHAQRFIAMANEDTANLPYFLLAVSRDAHPDDADDWHKYRFEVSAFTAGSTFIDSPNLGLNNDYIFLTADFFGPDKYLLFVVDKASVLEGGMALTAADLIVGTQSMGIPVVRDAANPALYIVESTEFGSNDTVILHAVTDPFGSFDRVEVEIDVDPYTFPIDPPQRDTTVRPELFEPRFWSVAHAGDSIWAVHHVDSARVRVRWYEFHLNGWPNTMGAAPSLAQSGEIDLGDGIHTFFPSLDADAQGNAAITFSRSATDEYISIWRAVRLASMPQGTFGPAVMVQESANAQTDGRWGDYSGTQSDPAAPGVFWGIHQFTNGDTGSWRTWAARYDDAAGLFGDGFESGDTTSWSSSVP